MYLRFRKHLGLSTCHLCRTLNVSIRFLHDRHGKAALDASHGNVAEALRKRRSVMMENGNETVAWVGIARTGDEDSCFFLPHGAPEDKDDREHFACQLMRAIVRFSREAGREGDGREKESSTNTALLAELAADYRDHGLYARREKLKANRDGKPDWARTVRSKTAFPAANGALLYTELATTRYSSRATNMVAQIQEQVIADIHRAHSWWLGPWFGSREAPRPDRAPAWPRETRARMLRLARRDLYENRAIRLVGLLIAFLEQEKETGEGEVFCGISDFSRLWEVMLRETIPGVESGWNSRLPRPAYFRGDGTRESTSGMEPDLVVRSGGQILILDAKYYRATSKGYLPGVQDISKQIVYQQALEATCEVAAGSIVNAFAFPGAVTQREPFERIRFMLPDGSAAPGFPPVLCQYVSVRDVVEAYAGRRKLDDADWVPQLCAQETPAKPVAMNLV